MAGIVLLDGVTADTSGVSVDFKQTSGDMNQDIFSVFCHSTDFGGGSVRIQISYDNTNWFTARQPGNDNQCIFTVADHRRVFVRAPYVRANLSGATSPDPMTVVLY